MSALKTRHLSNIACMLLADEVFHALMSALNAWQSANILIIFVTDDLRFEDHPRDLESRVDLVRSRLSSAHDVEVDL